MAVAFDAKCTAVTSLNAYGSPITNATLTLAAGATLIIGVFAAADTTTNAAATSMTWNGVSLTFVGSKVTTTGTAGIVYVYALASPATGNHTLSCAYTNGSGTNPGLYLDCFSFTGTDLVTANAVPSANVITSATNSSVNFYPPGALTVTTVSGDACAAAAQYGNPLTASTGTLINDTTPDNGGCATIYNLAVGATTSVQWANSIGTQLPGASVAFRIQQPQASGAVGWRSSRGILVPNTGPSRGLRAVQAFPVPAAAQAPFALSDWPNPIPSPRIDYAPAVQRAEALLAGPQVMPVFTRDWPNPIPPVRVDTAPVVQRSEALLSGPQLMPFVQTDWPGPTSVPRIDYAPIVQPFPGLRLVISLPFNQYDWPAPIQPGRINSAPTVDRSVALLSGPQLRPFAQTDWPVPVPPARIDYAPVVQPFRGLPTVVSVPFAQYDWPAPMLSPRIDTAPTVQRSAALLSGPQLLPFSQSNWPTPPAASTRVDYASVVQRFPGLSAVITVPFVQSDWPVPKSPFQPTQLQHPYNVTIYSTPVVGTNRFTVSGPGVIDLFDPVTGVSYLWSPTQRRTV